MNDKTDATPEESTAPELPQELSLQQHALQEIDAVGAKINELTTKYKDAVFDVGTTKGMDEAKAARKEIREPRYLVENIRKEKGAEIRKITNAINDRAAEITDQIRAIEDPIDAQIKAQEDIAAAKRAEREREAAEKLAAINARIFNIRQMPLNAMGADAAELQQAIDTLVAQDLEDFDDVHLPTAQQAKDEALTHLRRMLDDRTELDARAEELRLQAAEYAERQRLAAEHQAEADRLAKEERDRLDEEARIQREAEDAEAARVQAEAQERAQAQAAAEEAAIADATLRSAAEEAGELLHASMIRPSLSDWSEEDWQDYHRLCGLGHRKLAAALAKEPQA